MCHAAASFGSPFRSILFGRRRFLRGHVRHLMTSRVRDVSRCVGHSSFLRFGNVIAITPIEKAPFVGGDVGD